MDNLTTQLKVLYNVIFKKFEPTTLDGDIHVLRLCSEMFK